MPGQASRTLAPAASPGLVSLMTRPDEDRDRRLAEALRLNLRRRKDQARAADAPPPPDTPDLTPSPERP